MRAGFYRISTNEYIENSQLDQQSPSPEAEEITTTNDVRLRSNQQNQNNRSSLTISDQQQKQIKKSCDIMQKSMQLKHNQKSYENKEKLISLGVDEQYIQNGERHISDIQAGLKSSTFRLEGNLILTNYKLIYKITNGKYDSFGSPDFYHINLMLIQSCERTVEKKGNQFSYIDIQCKDIRKYQFRFKFEQNDDSFDFMTQLIENIFFKEKEVLKYPAFEFKKYYDLETNYDGWNIYNIRKEFERMKLQVYDEKNPKCSDQSNYLFKYLYNEQKEICETYPPLLAVPNNIPDDLIKKCSKFRSRERLPVLTFAFRSSFEQKIPFTLWRCSQCKTGFSNRSQEDEMMLRYIGDPTMKENKQQNNNINVHIYDARPYMNAVGNKIAGKGYESTNCYKNCEIYFLDIHNIHKVRDSFNKIVALCQTNDPQTKWFKEIDLTLWLEYISTILSGAVRICESLINNFKVVVHCSDGWDRTTQLCSLVQIFIDPFYRTIEGFSILIEKEWVYFGHMFNFRQGHGIRNQSEENYSPVFLQFLDCVHQVMNQYPLSFEFNEQFLVDLAFNSYSCMFGTFIANCYQDLIEKNIMSQTVSVWNSMKQKRNLYLNPFYQNQSANSEVLKPEFQQRSLKLWERFFFYYSNQKLDDYKIHQNCRFKDDNISCQYNKVMEKLQIYENIFKELDEQFQNKQKNINPKEIAQSIKNNIIMQFIQSKENQQQKQQQQQQEYQEQEQEQEQIQE